MGSYFSPLILLVLVFRISAAQGEDSPASPSPEADAPQNTSITERVHNIGGLNPSDYGIRRGCISLARISSINFLDDQSAIVSVRGGKKVLLRLARECHGIEYNGFVHQTRGQELCARFDTLRVMQTGIPCQIESLEPYVEVQETATGKKD